MKAPEHLHFLNDIAKPDDPGRPNRMCVCVSDVHFTDNSVGTQSAEDPVWEEVFDHIADTCLDEKEPIEELFIVLDGDIVDMIRTAVWAQHNVYPWQRDADGFKPALRQIMRRIVELHSRPAGKGAAGTGSCGFFHRLHQLREKLATRGVRVETIVILGNHDKEILADEEVLRMFYEECLRQPVAQISPDYRAWVGAMYGQDFSDPASVPWLPFYWGDRGFRLFLTHGQWRDEDNSRALPAQDDTPGWQVADGWRPETWRRMDYRPFTEPCFGDTVAAGLLSGFIWRTKERLQSLDRTTLPEETVGEISRIVRILDELDLYRPTYAAIRRILEAAQKLRSREVPAGTDRIVTIIEEEMLDSIRQWLAWDFTLESTTPGRRRLLRTVRVALGVLNLLGARIQLKGVYGLMWLLTQLRRHSLFAGGDSPSHNELISFPAFLPEYRECGFRIHVEGHTHIPLEEELTFDTPSQRRNYTYVNLGAWRDQLVHKRKKLGYRRRGIGRALCLLDLKPATAGGERRFLYRTEDVLAWADHRDRL